MPKPTTREIQDTIARLETVTERLNQLSDAEPANKKLMWAAGVTAVAAYALSFTVGEDAEFLDRIQTFELFALIEESRDA